MAREKSAEVKQLYERFGDQLSVYPQFSQFTVKDDPRVHRVVHLTYRVGKRDLSYPRPQVDLTLREVETPGPEQPSPSPRPTPPVAIKSGPPPSRVARNRSDRYRGTPNAPFACSHSVRYSCSSALPWHAVDGERRSGFFANPWPIRRRRK